MKKLNTEEILIRFLKKNMALGMIIQNLSIKI